MSAGELSVYASGGVSCHFVLSVPSSHQMQLQKCVQAAKVAAVAAHSCEEQGRMDAQSDLLEEPAALVDLCKVDTNVGLHAWCGNLEHPGSGV